MTGGAQGGARLAGLVLAGGWARRFGSDKLLVEVEGVSLVDRAVAACRAVCDGPVLAASGDGRRRPGVADGQVADLVDDGGPLAAVAAGLCALRSHEAVAVVAGDHVGPSPALLAVLAEVQLGDLAGRVGGLDAEMDWARILSVGEQQRLAFARVLFNRPRIVFLDESTSAMDEGLEDAMYRLLRHELPDTVVVSVGHRSTLYRHHPRQLVLAGNGEGGWELAQ